MEKKYKGYAVVGKRNEIITISFVEPKNQRPLVLLGFTKEEAKNLKNDKLLKVEFTLKY